MAKIVVDVEELIDKLDEMIEDDYTDVLLEIDEDDYTSELHVSAVSLEDEEPISYGTIYESTEDLC